MGTIRIYIFTFIICLICITQTHALEISLESSAGYDDNVPQTDVKQGSGFVFYQAGFVQPFFKSNELLESHIFAQAGYNDYFKVKDKWNLQAFGTISYPIYNRQINAGIISQGLIYRDNFIEEDDRDELGIGGFIDWLATERLTFTLTQTWTWADYKNLSDVMMLMPTKQPDNMGKMQPKVQNQAKFRNDNIYTTDLQTTIYISPFLYTEILLEHIRLDSSLDIESYKENNISNSFIWTLGKAWEINVLGSFRHLKYDKSPENIDRKDNIYHGKIGISRFIKNFEIYFQFKWEKNDSSDKLEDYSQRVTQCGFIWSF